MPRCNRKHLSFVGSTPQAEWSGELGLGLGVTGTMLKGGECSGEESNSVFCELNPIINYKPWCLKMNKLKQLHILLQWSEASQIHESMYLKKFKGISIEIKASHTYLSSCPPSRGKIDTQDPFENQPSLSKQTTNKLPNRT